MGTLRWSYAVPGQKPFADESILDAAVDPQFNGVFPDDPALGIVSERKANDTNTRTDRDPRRSKNNEVQPDDPSPSRLR